MNDPMSLTIDGDNYIITQFSGTERISDLFTYQIKLMSELSVNFNDVIGKQASVSIFLANGRKRYFNGIISSFSRKRGGASCGIRNYLEYSATIVPWFWMPTRKTASRIFEKKSVPEIVEDILNEYSSIIYEMDMQTPYENQQNARYDAYGYPKREYCVQYQETDFNFISRLLEDEGIFYYFEHKDDGSHKLILADHASYTDCPDLQPVTFNKSDDMTLLSLNSTQEIRSEKYTCSDFNFETASTVSCSSTNDVKNRELYEYPGGYGLREVGERRSNIRMQEEEACILSNSGSGNCRSFTSGYKFTLDDEANPRETFLLTFVRHIVTQSYLSSGDVDNTRYRNGFTCIPGAVQFRPQRKMPKPVVQGSQTAIVVGFDESNAIDTDPATGADGVYENKIHTDAHGRVRVRFHWDRDPEKCSCWAWVNQISAGHGWGSMFIPHTGHEVIVDFLEGDPDRPIVTGAVYHGKNPPYYKLPDPNNPNDPNADNHKKSVIRDARGNELLFDATEGKESVALTTPKSTGQLVIDYLGIHRFSNKDSHEVTMGNTLEYGIGNTFSFFGGNATELKVGNFSEALIGNAFSFFAGGKYEWNIGYQYEWSKFPQLKQSEKDMLSIADQDHVLAAGDQICLISGAKAKKGEKKILGKTITPGVPIKNASVLDLYPDKVLLSIGPKKSGGDTNLKHPPGAKKPKVINPDDDIFGDSDAKWPVIIALLTNAVATVLAAGSYEGLQFLDGSSGEDKWWEQIASGAASTILTGAGCGALFVMAGVMIAKRTRDEAIEPVEHKEPAAKLEMDKDGVININSKEKEIVIGAGATTGDEEAKIFIGQNGIVIESRSASIGIKKDGNITINSDKSVIIESGTGNIDLIAKKKVRAKGDAFDINGVIRHKYFEVLAK